MAVLSDTIKGEKVDLAASVSFNDSKMLAVGGITVVGGKKLDTALQEVLKLAAEEPGAPAIKLNADTHKGVVFHSMSMPLPPDPTFNTVFGSALDVVHQRNLAAAVPAPLQRRLGVAGRGAEEPHCFDCRGSDKRAGFARARSSASRVSETFLQLLSQPSFG